MDQPYSQELNAPRSAFGFTNRRLEAEYRHTVSIRSERNVRRQLLIAIGLLSALCVLDFMQAPVEYARAALAWRATVMLPFVALPFALTYYRRHLWLRQLGGTVTVVAIAAASLYLSAVAARFGQPLVPGGYMLIVVFCFFFLGLRLAVSILAALLVLALFVLAALGSDAPPAAVAYNMLFLAAMSLVCAMGAQQLELARRRDFLTDRLLQFHANFDALTQLPNRRAFDIHLEKSWKAAQTTGGSLSVLLLDIDHFKRFNDTYGHQAGDDTLQRVAKALRRAIKRPEDIAARYGGEEFAIVLRDATAASAVQLAEEIRNAIARENIPHASSLVAKHLTVSIGVSWCVPGKMGRSPTGLLQEADEALYVAKDQGRDRVVSAESMLDPTKTGAFKRHHGMVGARHGDLGYL